MKAQTQWVEALRMNNHLDPEFVKRKIDEFAAHCADNGETAKEKRDCMRHFNNWLRKIRQPAPGRRGTIPVHHGRLPASVGHIR